VVHWRPRRDVTGRVTRPARIWLTSQERPRPPAENAGAVLPVPGDWLAGLSPGDTIKLFDARDSMRTMRVSAFGEGGVWAESDQSAYVVPGTTLQLPHNGGPAVAVRRTAAVGALSATVQDIVLAQGDLLLLTRDAQPGVRPRLRAMALSSSPQSSARRFRKSSKTCCPASPSGSTTARLAA
jgi:pyruvate kinase